MKQSKNGVSVQVVSDRFLDKNQTPYLIYLQVLPVIIFFSSFISVCYYFGIMQVVIKKISWLMQVTMGTSAVESLNAAGNIFVGQVKNNFQCRVCPLIIV